MTDRKPFFDTHPHLREFSAFLQEFNKETERGAALAAGAMLEDQLGKVLEAFLIPNKGANDLLKGFNAPLGSFSAKIAASHSMGLVADDEALECNLIRKVRNEFAHNVHMSFEDAKIIGLCSGLTFGIIEKGVARTTFSTAVAGLILHLTNRPAYVSQQRLKAEHWPY
jgi:mannitol operon repressor